jgi:hypothetical protein
MGWLQASGAYCPLRRVTRAMGWLGQSRSGRFNTFVFLFYFSFSVFLFLS